MKFLHTSLGWHVPAVFSYVSTRMLMSAITTLVLTILLGPRVIGRLYNLTTGQRVRVEDCPMLAKIHKKKTSTPSMGGVLILFSMVVSLLLWMDLTSLFTLILLVTTLFLGWVGGYDDYLKIKTKSAHGFRAKRKFGLQIVLACVVALCLYFFPDAFEKGRFFKPPVAKIQTHSIKEGKTNSLSQSLSTQEYMRLFYLPFKKGPLFSLSGWLALLGVGFTIFVITGTSNAVNLTDGLDGLASGILVMVAGVLALVAFLSNHLELARYLNILYIEGSGEIAIYLCGLIGACLGFLWYNGHPAQVFMGDTGSLALGGVLGVSAVLLRREFLLALAGGIFVIEALSVILQVSSYRWRNKKRIFLCTPIHHHFECIGWPETKVVLRFWIVGLILAMIAIISLKFQ